MSDEICHGCNTAKATHQWPFLCFSCYRIYDARCRIEAIANELARSLKDFKQYCGQEEYSQTFVYVEKVISQAR